MSALPTDADWPPLRHPERLLAVHERGPDEHDEFPFGRRCLACLQPWPCPAAQGRRRTEEAERKAATAHARRLAAEASRTGLRALVVEGVTVWSSTHRVAEGPRGGVVVAVEDVLDKATGEYERRWTCLDVTAWPKVGVHVVNEGEVKAGDVDTTSTAMMARLLYRLAWEVWKMGRPRRTDGYIMRTSIDTRVVDHLRYMLTLARLLMGGG